MLGYSLTKGFFYDDFIIKVWVIGVKKPSLLIMRCFSNASFEYPAYSKGTEFLSLRLD